MNSPSRVSRYDPIGSEGSRLNTIGEEEREKTFGMMSFLIEDRTTGRATMVRRKLVFDGVLFSREQQCNYSVYKKNGCFGKRLCDKNGKLLPPNERLVYVVIPDKRSVRDKEFEDRLIIVRESEATHSQLAHTKGVKFAGELIVNDCGEIEEINYNTGRYQLPSSKKCDRWFMVKIIEVLKNPSSIKTITKNVKNYKENTRRAKEFEKFIFKKLYPYLTKELQEKTKSCLDDDNVSTSEIKLESFFDDSSN
jgi:hypothetical protein